MPRETRPQVAGPFERLAEQKQMVNEILIYAGGTEKYRGGTRAWSGSLSSYKHRREGTHAQPEA
jgi:hypothetical protein